MRVGLISDTHGRVRPEVFRIFEDVDLILHAGDVGPADILTELEAIAPVQAVFGNTDTFELRRVVREVIELELEGVQVTVLHGHQFGSPQAAALRAAYPDADVIVYGHTHRQRVDRVDGCVVVNPGAAGPARFNLKPAVALLEIGEGAVRSLEHVEI